MPPRSPEAIARARAARNVASSAAKRKRVGTCETCGGHTRYHGGAGAAQDGTARTCATCSRAANAERARQTSGTGRLQIAILEHLASVGEARRIELRDAAGTTSQIIAPTVLRMMRQGLIVRVRPGVYRLPEEAA